MEQVKKIDGKYDYYAFISYKREDEAFAKWLQHKLEHYRLPSNLNGRTNLPKRVSPIFRDVEELNPGNLPKQIQHSLKSSKFLIVICSPRSAKSEWVDKEVQIFLSMGRLDSVIPFIIAGSAFAQNPNEECFPMALRTLPNENEILGANVSEMGRDAAAVKVVSKMFDLKFDQLWRRYEREQRLKRIIWIVGAFFLGLTGLFVGAYFMRQNHVIETQNEQLHNLITSLTEANNTYSLLQGDQKQYIPIGELRGNNCEDISLMFFAYHPYEPIVAFSDDFGFWLHYLNSNTEVLLPTPPSMTDYFDPVTEVEYLSFSVDGTELLAESSAGVYVWDVVSCQLLRCYAEERQTFLESREFKKKYPNYGEEYVFSESDNSLPHGKYYNCKNGIISVCDGQNNRVVCSTHMEIEEDSVIPEVLVNPNYNEVLFTLGGRAALYDDAKGGFVLFFKYDYPHEVEYSSSGDYLRINKNLYGRTAKVDTIQNLKYTINQSEIIPFNSEWNDYKYDLESDASIKIGEKSVIYKSAGGVKTIEVLKQYSHGNVQEYLYDVLFAGPNKIVVVVGQGRHRVYNVKTGTLLGTLSNYIYDGLNPSMGLENELCHAQSGISTAKYINRKLYVLSSGAIIRVYDVDKLRLKAVLELPFERTNSYWVKCIENCFLADDGSKVYYSFEDEPFYYECELPIIK